MKISEALIEKKALHARINDLQTRYIQSAILEDGDQPEESADELLAAYQGAFARWEELTIKINQTNNVIKVGDITMMEAIARRDVLKTQIGHYASLRDQIRTRNSGRRLYGETTPKTVLATNVNAQFFIKLCDSLAQEMRILDVNIQAANWANDLVD
jgi:hypothetical protein